MKIFKRKSKLFLCNLENFKMSKKKTHGILSTPLSLVESVNVRLEVIVHL